MGVYTSPDNLYKPDPGESGWGALVSANFETIQSRLTAAAPAFIAGADPTGATDSTGWYGSQASAVAATPTTGSVTFDVTEPLTPATCHPPLNTSFTLGIGGSLEQFLLTARSVTSTGQDTQTASYTATRAQGGTTAKSHSGQDVVGLTNPLEAFILGLAAGSNVKLSKGTYLCNRQVTVSGFNVTIDASDAVFYRTYQSNVPIFNVTNFNNSTWHGGKLYGYTSTLHTTADYSSSTLTNANDNARITSGTERYARDKDQNISAVWSLSQAGTPALNDCLMVMSEYRFDITPPTTALTATAQAVSTGMAAGDHWYAVSFVISEKDGATGPGVFTYFNAAASNTPAQLTNIPIGPAGVVARNIYRTKANQLPTAGKLFLVATIVDNTTTSYLDTMTDATLGTKSVQANYGAVSPGTLTAAAANYTATYSLEREDTYILPSVQRLSPAASNAITVGNMSAIGQIRYQAGFVNNYGFQMSGGISRSIFEDWRCEGVVGDSWGTAGSGARVDNTVRRFYERGSGRMGFSVTQGSGWYVSDGVAREDGYGGFDCEPDTEGVFTSRLQMRRIRIYNWNVGGVLATEWGRIRDWEVTDLYLESTDGGPAWWGGCHDGHFKNITCVMQNRTTTSIGNLFQIEGGGMMWENVTIDCSTGAFGFSAEHPSVDPVQIDDVNPLAATMSGTTATFWTLSYVPPGVTQLYFHANPPGYDEVVFYVTSITTDATSGGSKIVTTTIPPGGSDGAAQNLNDHQYGTLNANILSTDTSIVVNETGDLTPPATPFHFVIDYEYMTCSTRTLISGSQYTYVVTRHNQGTLAAAHSANALVLDSRFFDNNWNLRFASEGVSSGNNTVRGLRWLNRTDPGKAIFCFQPNCRIDDVSFVSREPLAAATTYTGMVSTNQPDFEYGLTDFGNLRAVQPNTYKGVAAPRNLWFPGGLDLKSERISRARSLSGTTTRGNNLSKIGATLGNGVTSLAVTFPVISGFPDFTSTAIGATSTVVAATRLAVNVETGQLAVPGNGHIYVSTTTATTGGAEPTWPTGSGATVLDGTVTWQEAGVPFVGGVTYFYKVTSRGRYHGPRAPSLAEFSRTPGANEATEININGWNNSAWAGPFGTGFQIPGCTIYRGTTTGVYTKRYDVVPTADFFLAASATLNRWIVTDLGTVLLNQDPGPGASAVSSGYPQTTLQTSYSGTPADETGYEPDTNYGVFVQFSYNAGAWWITNQTTAGFTINWVTATPNANQTLSWMVVR